MDGGHSTKQRATAYSGLAWVIDNHGDDRRLRLKPREDGEFDERRTRRRAALLQRRSLLRGAGFEILEVEDRTSHAQAFFQGAIEAAKAAGRPAAVGLHLLTGETTAQKFANMLSAVSDGRLAPSMIVARKS